MRIRVPEYFTNFKCIADKCRDSCCIGWEIDIDDDTMAKYKTLDGSIGREIAKKTSHGYFPLCENGRCAFLDESGLCRIISELGDGYLCDICREHPRYYGVGDGIIDGGIGLGCEEAARIISKLNSLPRFVEIERDVHYLDEDEYADTSEEIREMLYALIFDKPIDILANAFKQYATVADEIAFEISTSGNCDPIPKITLDNIRTDELESIYHNIFDLISECEALSEDWAELTERACRIPATTALLELNAKRGLIYYFTHRYVREGIEDMSLGQRVLFALGSALAVSAISCVIDDDESTVTAAVAYSKNIEYSTDNVDYMLENIEIL